ncbi:MAG: GFA family protein [Acidobacteria bacterium]|nr:GFA family protein [Acidobacteriota bacterium]
MNQTYQGSCHCGAVRFEADLDLSQPSFRCNCSICRRNRFWPAIAKPDQFRLLQGQDQLTEYRFNTQKNQHFFCKTCGVRPFGIGNDTPIGQMIGINIGCLENVSEEQLSQIPIVYVDGQNNRWDSKPEFWTHL